MKLSELCEQFELSYRYDGQKEADGWEHFAWVCTLRHPGLRQSIELPYKKGLAYRRWKKSKRHFQKIRIRGDLYAVPGEPVPCGWEPRTVFEADLLAKESEPTPPTLAEVVAAVVRDGTHTVDQFESVDDMMDEYEMKPSAALRAWKYAHEFDGFLRHTLSGDEFAAIRADFDFEDEA